VIARTLSAPAPPDRPGFLLPEGGGCSGRACLAVPLRPVLLRQRGPPFSACAVNGARLPRQGLRRHPRIWEVRHSCAGPSHLALGVARSAWFGPVRAADAAAAAAPADGARGGRRTAKDGWVLLGVWQACAGETEAAWAASGSGPLLRQESWPTRSGSRSPGPVFVGGPDSSNVRRNEAGNWPRRAPAAHKVVPTGPPGAAPRPIGTAVRALAAANGERGPTGASGARAEPRDKTGARTATGESVRVGRVERIIPREDLRRAPMSSTNQPQPTKEATDAIKCVTEGFAALQASNAKLREENKSLRDANQQLTAQANAPKLPERPPKQCASPVELQNALKDLAAANQKVDGLVAQAAKLRDETKAKDDRVIKMAEALSKLDAEKKAAQKQLGELQTAQTSNAAGATACARNLDAATKDVASLRDQLDVARANVAAAASKDDALNCASRDLEQLKSRLRTIQTQLGEAAEFQSTCASTSKGPPAQTKLGGKPAVTLTARGTGSVGRQVSTTGQFVGTPVNGGRGGWRGRSPAYGQDEAHPFHQAARHGGAVSGFLPPHAVGGQRNIIYQAVRPHLPAPVFRPSLRWVARQAR
jgi:hypothetical protein